MKTGYFMRINNKTTRSYIMNKYGRLVEIVAEDLNLQRSRKNKADQRFREMAESSGLLCRHRGAHSRAVPLNL